MSRHSKYTSSSSPTSLDTSLISNESLSEYEDGEIIVEKIVRKKKGQQKTERWRPPSPAYERHKKRKSTSDEERKSKKMKKAKMESPPSSPDRKMNEQIEEQLDDLRERLRRKRRTFKKYPEEHTRFKLEWGNFTAKMKGKEMSESEFHDAWKKFWERKIKEVDEEEIERKRAELQRKYRVMDVDKRIAKTKKRRCESPANPRYLAFNPSHQLAGPSKTVPEASTLLKPNEKRMRMEEMPETAKPSTSTFSEKKTVLIPPQPRGLPSSSQARPLSRQKLSSPLKELPPSRPVPPPTPNEPAPSPTQKSTPPATKEATPSPTKEPTLPPTKEPTAPVQPKVAESKETDQQPSLLQILRLLAGLEEHLGSLGATVLVVLSRVRSLEREQPGSSAPMAHEVISLIDTSRERLLAQLEMQLIEGARAKAAQSLVEKIDKFLQTIDKPKVVPVAPVPIRALPADMPPLVPIHPEVLPPLDEQVLQSTAAESSTDDKPLNDKSCDVLPPLDEQVPRSTAAESSTDDKPLNDESCGFKLPVDKSPVGKSCDDKLPHGTSPDGNNNKKGVATVDHFTGEELTILIKNYQVLRDSQKRDLVHYIRKVEGPVSRDDTRLPVVFSLTGYNVSDLKRLGLPLEEIYESRCGSNSDSSGEVTIISAPPKNPRDPRLNRQPRREQVKPH